jgi:hypothetical protein
MTNKEMTLDAVNELNEIAGVLREHFVIGLDQDPSYEFIYQIASKVLIAKNVAHVSSYLYHIHTEINQMANENHDSIVNVLRDIDTVLNYINNNHA